LKRIAYACIACIRETEWSHCFTIGMSGGGCTQKPQLTIGGGEGIGRNNIYGCASARVGM
jgi:hypothetical protein